MKVTGTGQGTLDRSRDIAGTVGARPVDKSKDGRRTGRAPEIDSGISEKVAISSKAKEAMKAKEVAKSAPEIDEAKVAKLKAALQNGSYKVDADKIADRLVDEHLFNSI